MSASCAGCRYEAWAGEGFPCSSCEIDPRTGDHSRYDPKDGSPTREASTPPARKDDNGKTPWHLLPYDAVESILQILSFGAGKYGDRNWEGGMAWSRVFSALQRHLSAWWQGEKADPETGNSHLWHAGCCICFLIAYELRGVGKDDRPQKTR